MVVVVAGLLLSCAGTQSPSPVCLAGAQLTDDGRCEPGRTAEHHLPFRDGYEARVTQSFHGYETHREDVAYAVDFACEEGTPITASRSGVVWSVYDESTENCDRRDCVDLANYVILDHGDGTFSAYYHLQHKGATVEPGDQVCRGQLLGLCGDTGFATGSHLHFSILDTNWQTLPVAFAETQSTKGGVVLPRQSYESENKREPYCADTDYSRLGQAAFAHRGVWLETEIPTMIQSRDDRMMRIEGEYRGEDSHVAFHRREINGGGDWIEKCAPVDDDGNFSLEIEWPEHVFTDGYYFLMLTGSDEDCNAPGWAWAYRVRVRPSEIDE